MQSSYYMKDFSPQYGDSMQQQVMVTMHKVYEVETWTHRMTDVIAGVSS